MLKLCESGYSVTQATVSRDINSLRLVKVPDGSGRYKYAETGMIEPSLLAQIALPMIPEEVYASIVNGDAAAAR